MTNTPLRYPSTIQAEIRTRYERVDDGQSSGLGGARDRETGQRLSYTEIGRRLVVSKYKIQRELATPQQIQHRLQWHKEYGTRYRATHKPELKTYMQNEMRRYADDKTRIVKMLGGKCAACGIADSRVLCVNHKNGDGSKDRRMFKGQRKLYRAIVRGTRGISDLELRCFNCNEIYEYERGRKGVLNLKKAVERRL